MSLLQEWREYAYSEEMQNSKEFLEAVVKTYHNEIGKEFNPEEFWI